MQIVAQGWLIYRLAIPRSCSLWISSWRHSDISFSLIGGVVADRVERRKILLSPNMYKWPRRHSHYSCCHQPGPRLAHSLPFVCLRFSPGLRRSGYQALIPTLVEKEDMPNAIALNSIQFNVAVMVVRLSQGRPWRNWERNGALA